jgi:hypothetical protein
MKSAILLISLYVVTGFSAERITTSQIHDVQNFVTKKKAELGAESVLVVYDFDNTLMAMNQDAGSDQWYNWQQTALKSGNKKEAWVSTQSELYDLHYKLFALGQMHATEKETPLVVKTIQDMKIKSIVLTSRGDLYRNDVEIELDRIDTSFKASAIGPEGGYPSTFKPDGIENARNISYQDGILMGSGQNKGQILKWLLKKTNSQFKAIVFVDDTLKNIENVEKEYIDDKSVTVFYYTHEESRVKKFEKDKAQVKAEWKKLKPLLQFYEKKDQKLNQ